MGYDEVAEAINETAAYMRVRPIYTLDSFSDEAVHQWVVNAKNYAKSRSEYRIKEIRDNIRLYMGDHWEHYDTRDERARARGSTFPTTGSDAAPDTAEVVVNHLYDLLENLVSRITRYKPTVNVLPANSDEVSDRNASRLVKQLIDYLGYINNFEDLMQRVARYCRIAGEAFLFVEWDKNKGQEFPAFQEEKKERGKKAIKIDEKDDESYSTVPVGDVSFRVANPDRMYLEPTSSGDFDEVDWALEEHTIDVDKLRKKYPKHAYAIKAGHPQDVYDLAGVGEIDEYEGLENETIVFEFWQKSSPEYPEGRRIVFTDDLLLENTPLPFKHGKFPFVRITNIDIPGRLHGRSIFSNARQLNQVINIMDTMILRNQVLVGHPKWVVPRNAHVKPVSFGNDITKMEYDGQVPPTLLTYNNTPAEVFNFKQDTKEELQQIMGVFGVSRGEPPPGIKAGIALQFLNEQENERFNQDVSKHNEMIKQIWQLALEVIRQFYDKGDKRMIRIFGKHGEFQTKAFDPITLNTAFDIRVQNSSALPQSKAARTQVVLDLMERFPDAIPQSKGIEILELGVPELMVNEATKATQAADIENEEMGSNEKVGAPKIWEEHLSHWQSHFTYMQSYSFKMAPEKIQKNFENHLAAHEKIMMDKAFQDDGVTPKNPILAEQLASLRTWPAIIELAPPPEPAPIEPPAPLPPEAMLPPPGPVPPPIPPEMAAQLALSGGALPPGLPPEALIPPEGPIAPGLPLPPPLGGV